MGLPAVAALRPGACSRASSARPARPSSCGTCCSMHRRPTAASGRPKPPNRPTSPTRSRASPRTEPRRRFSASPATSAPTRLGPPAPRARIPDRPAEQGRIGPRAREGRDGRHRRRGAGGAARGRDRTTARSCRRCRSPPCSPTAVRSPKCWSVPRASRPAVASSRPSRTPAPVELRPGPRRSAAPAVVSATGRLRRHGEPGSAQGQDRPDRRDRREHPRQLRHPGEQVGRHAGRVDPRQRDQHDAHGVVSRRRQSPTL